jgi:cytochrome c5
LFNFSGETMKLNTIGALLAAGMLLASTQALAGGKEVYESTCVACHGTGAAGAPKLGDKAAWAPRIKDVNAAHASALKGKGVMPPKGGNAALSDADVIAAADYMISQAK